MVKIPLTQGREAIIDNEDYELVSKYKWHYADYLNGRGYAKTNNHGKRPRLLRMHRLIMQAEPGEKIDHISMDTLDNRKSNLRRVNQSQNMMNSGLRNTNKSGFKGVCYLNRSELKSKWLATIWKDGKQINLGCHKTKEEAALAYNKAAKGLHGEFARLNII